METVKTMTDLKNEFGADKIEAVDLSGNIIESTEDANGKMAMDDRVLQEAINYQKAKTEKLNARMRELISGKIPPPNEFVEYQIKTLRDNQTELEALRANLIELEKQAQKMQEQVLLLQGEQRKCLRDIQEWDKPKKDS